MAKILIVDDEPDIRSALGRYFERSGHDVLFAATGEEGVVLVQTERPAVVLLDLFLPDISGFDVLERTQEQRPVIIMITGHGDIPAAVHAMQAGAEGFLTKPVELAHLGAVVERALEKAQLRELSRAADTRIGRASADMLLGSSAPMRELAEQIEMLARSERTVALLVGEYGVGKARVARAIHALSPRASRPFHEADCALRPIEFLDTDLFGIDQTENGPLPGLFEAANGGTLFLDEISDMPADLQTRFLRVLQEREYRPLGSTQTMKADFRAIASTNRPVAQALSENRLRSDLYYRLNTFQIEVPPLRKRKQDIPPLIALFLRQFAQQLGKPEPDISPDAFQKLLDYAWPGNVRELQNAIEYAVVLARQGMIGVKELPTEIQLPHALQQTELAALPRTGVQSLDDVERTAILKALAECHGNKKKAAELLGIQRPTLYNKMKRYAIEL
jgi:DNA-binding NtrC family response regulator